MLLTLHPLAEVQRRYRQTEYGLEAEMSAEEARAVGGEPGKLWWEVSNQASALYLTGHTDEALDVAKRALKMKRSVQTLINLAVILETQGRFDEALLYERDACNFLPQDDRATALYGEALLRLGRFKEGWPYYRKNRASMEWAKAYLPEWEGPAQDLGGKRVLVIEGGGYGDNIYMLRWVDTLREMGARLTYICNPSFAPIAQAHCYLVIKNYQGNVDVDQREYDYFCPLLSLPGKLGVTLENYRWEGPYIRRRLNPFRFRKFVGLCWKAGEAKSPRKQRSLSNEQRQRIVGALPPRYSWVNLSHGHVDDAMMNPKMDDWADTAKAVSNCVHVVSVDTGVAHLAGAMGISASVVLPGAGAWQYPLGHDRHPLYPSMRIFRNPREGQDEAVDLLVSELSKY